jgi:hypothetical protein
MSIVHVVDTLRQRHIYIFIIPDKIGHNKANITFKIFSYTDYVRRSVFPHVTKDKLLTHSELICKFCYSVSQIKEGKH